MIDYLYNKARFWECVAFFRPGRQTERSRKARNNGHLHPFCRAVNPFRQAVNHLIAGADAMRPGQCSARIRSIPYSIGISHLSLTGSWPGWPGLRQSQLSLDFNSTTNQEKEPGHYIDHPLFSLFFRISVRLVKISGEHFMDQHTRGVLADRNPKRPALRDSFLFSKF